MRKILTAVVGSVAVLFGTAANAAIDLTAVTAAFGELSIAQIATGGLLLVAAVTAVSYKWIKGMLFG